MDESEAGRYHGLNPGYGREFGSQEEEEWSFPVEIGGGAGYARSHDSWCRVSNKTPIQMGRRIPFADPDIDGYRRPTLREARQRPTASFQRLTREPSTLACELRLAVNLWRCFLTIGFTQDTTLDTTDICR